MNILTIVTADVDQGQAQELIAAYEMLLAGGLPDGLLETQLLGDGQGHWAIHSLWRDRAARTACRSHTIPTFFDRTGIGNHVGPRRQPRAALINALICRGSVVPR